jgi:non-specific serine/threonine protein kinase/serine/threonine-protein kinase
VSDDHHPPDDLAPTETAGPFDDGTPGRIGDYRILQKLGEGGMGEVFEAEQEKPVRRKVALKLIKWGMDTKQVIARFESERQALAMMDHPSIARVYDGGATEQGRPYFAMEFVKGESITQYCDRHLLSTRERLKLFMQVCEGVQHAHQKGIIHRDLKPSNVLVTIQDDKPVPKIIDFGVAKATEQRLTEKTVFTQMGVLIGTPEYMSPEQAEMTVLDIDTRTDVYSLGVMLYEMMTGVLPFDQKELRSSGFDEIRRKIREQEPSRPSARISTLPDVAKKRKIDLPALRRELRGDLDWITLRAMEKDRTRRYGSPSELAADVERYLTDQPVLATPPSVAYKTKKFVKRHKVGVVAGAAVFLALIAGIAGTTIGLVRATKAEAEAKREAAAAEQVSDFLVELFNVSNPSEARGNTITAREILDKGAEKIETELADQPEVQVRLMNTMSMVYSSLGLVDEALHVLGLASTICVERLGDDHRLTAGTKEHLAWLHNQRLEFGVAEALFREVLETRRRTLGSDHQSTMLTMQALGNVLQLQHRVEEAEPLFRELWERRKRVLGEDHEETISTGFMLAAMFANAERYSEAETYFREHYESMRRIKGPNTWDTASSMLALGDIVWRLGRDEEAESLLDDALEILRAEFEENHPTRLMISKNVAGIFFRHGRYHRAESLLEENLELLSRVLGENHKFTIEAPFDLACAKAALGKREEALNWLGEAIRRGYSNVDWIAKAPAFESLRGDPEFERIVARIKERTEEGLHDLR